MTGRGLIMFKKKKKITSICLFLKVQLKIVITLFLLRILLKELLVIMKFHGLMYISFNQQKNKVICNESKFNG